MKIVNYVAARLLLGILALSLATEAQAQNSLALPDAPVPQSAEEISRSQSQPQAAQTEAAQAQASQPQQPVGTAAAQPLITTGVAASKPAGFALAPRKQHRTRSILIKVGAILGAGAAVGTTLALTQASPSRPPGATTGVR